jgi:hypothetical protein
MMNGGKDVVWFGCHQGFRLGAIEQTPSSPSGLLKSDMPGFAGALLQNQDGENIITFSCDRIPQASGQK